MEEPQDHAGNPSAGSGLGTGVAAAASAPMWIQGANAGCAAAAVSRPLPAKLSGRSPRAVPGPGKGARPAPAALTGPWRRRPLYRGRARVGVV